MSKYEYKTAPINIRVDESIKVAIVEIADSQHRSMSNLIELILKEYIKNEHRGLS